jgi:membrane-associated phospholipid phosphatase
MIRGFRRHPTFDLRAKMNTAPLSDSAGAGTDWPRRPIVRGGWVLCGVFVLLGFAALAVDPQVAQWCRAGRLPGDLQKLLNLAEVFGHGAGVTMVLLAVWILDPARRWGFARLAVTTYGAGLIADLLKLVIARTRPRAFDFAQGVLDSFGQVFAWGAGGSNQQSFPSAHIATALGLAFGLTWLYPRGRWFFAALAMMVAGQRIASGAHFPSDVSWGAAIGCAVAILCLDAGPLARWFDRRETRWRRTIA